MNAGLFVKHQQRHGGDRLGHRPDAGDVIAPPGGPGFDVGITCTVEVGELAAARDENRTARPAPDVSITLHPLCQARQPSSIEAECRRITYGVVTKSTHRSQLLSQTTVLGKKAVRVFIIGGFAVFFNAALILLPDAGLPLRFPKILKMIKFANAGPGDWASIVLRT